MKKGARILIVEDEKEMLNGLVKITRAFGHDVVGLDLGEVACKLLEEEEFDLVICDLFMPNIDGMEILKRTKELHKIIPVIIITAYGSIPRAVEAMKAGAFDFLEKPFDAEHIKVVINKALEHYWLRKERNILLNQLEKAYGLDNIIGVSEPIKYVFGMIENVGPTDVNVLITGESGTGKELVARAIHTHSYRKTKPFVPVNCGALPENLFESELFGYEKGAFTGAIRRKPGLLEMANEGTFFLDEVCELTETLQVKLLRVLQDKKVRRLGQDRSFDLDVRFISASNRNIEEALQEGKLRDDLYYRLNVVSIHLPPLRERKEDIPILSSHFLKKFVKRTNKNIVGFSEETLERFESYTWPGNIRELENAIERAVTMAKEELIQLEDLPTNIYQNKAVSDDYDNLSIKEAKQKAIDRVERNYLIRMLRKYKGNISRIAKDAGMTRRNLHRLLNRHKIDPNIWRKLS
jgi:DNA-binding NtrC family response regulator